jgi:hypothetical protein
MGRISERISQAMSTMECPGCGKRVVPTRAAPPGAPAPTPAPPADGDQRWSFIWRPPSGQVCPECFFPLARYARRLKWVRTFSTGLVVLVMALMLFILWLLNPAGGWAVRAAQVMAAVGVVVLAVGLAGIVVGGRRTAGDGPPP